MAYTCDIANILAAQLEKFATLNRHQLAGQLANLGFWAAETAHGLAIIDGYGSRFERLKDAQGRHVAEYGTKEFLKHDPCCTETTASPPTRIHSQELGQARRRLCDAFYRFLVRCFNESLLEEASLRRWCNRLDIGVESRDLRRQI